MDSFSAMQHAEPQEGCVQRYVDSQHNDELADLPAHV